MAALVDCACGGQDQGCLLCQGRGQLVDAFANRTDEHRAAACETCGTWAICILVPGRLYEEMICAECYTKRYHPDLYAAMEAERQEAYEARLRATAIDTALPIFQRRDALQKLVDLSNQVDALVAGVA